MYKTAVPLVTKLVFTCAVTEVARTRRYEANKILMPFITHCYIIKKFGTLCGFTYPSARVYFLPRHSYGNVNRDLTLQIVALFDNDDRHCCCHQNLCCANLIRSV